LAILSNFVILTELRRQPSEVDGPRIGRQSGGLSIHSVNP